jgi:hypothetical protein
VTTRYTHFLIVFDHDHNRQVAPPREFDDAAEATAAYSATEEQYADERDHIEVVLLASDSLETVRHTHPVFFGGDVPFVDRLRRLVEEAETVRQQEC